MHTPGVAAAVVSPGIPPVVEAQDVTKRFGSTAALKDVSIRVMPGESHALVGRNGAGKSTLVSILTGLRMPDTGEVRFGGALAPSIADRDAWRERVACVYQHSTIIRDLTVARTIRLMHKQTALSLATQELALWLRKLARPCFTMRRAR